MFLQCSRFTKQLYSLNINEFTSHSIGLFVLIQVYSIFSKKYKSLVLSRTNVIKQLSDLFFFTFCLNTKMPRGILINNCFSVGEILLSGLVEYSIVLQTIEHLFPKKMYMYRLNTEMLEKLPVSYNFPKFQIPVPFSENGSSVLISSFSNFKEYKDLLEEDSLNLNDQTFDIKVSPRINYLSHYVQSVRFYIHKKALRVIESDFYSFLINHMELTDKDLSCLFYSLEEYCSLKENCSISNLCLAKESSEFYSKNKFKIHNFIDSFCIAMVLSRIDYFYFPTFLDWRGRLYYSGYPINPQGGPFSRLVLKFYEEKTPVKHLDVAASGFLQLAMLSGDFFTLEKTRFLKSGSNDYQDFYLYHLEHFREKLKTLPKVPEEFLVGTCSCKSLGIYNEFLDRKIFKSLAMRKIYGQTVGVRTTDLVTEFKKKVDYIDFFVCKQIAEQLDIYFRDSLCAINDLCQTIYKVLDSRALANLPLILETASKHLNSPMPYVLKKRKLIFYKKYNKTKSKFVNTECVFLGLRQPLKIDRLKCRRAIIPNFVHQIDSAVLFNTIEELASFKIPVYVVHDCFYVPEKHEFFVKKAFFNAQLKLLEDNPMCNFFKVNNFDNKELIKKYTEISHKVREFSIETGYPEDILK